jgi:glycine/D-amino acid oxidase-like deaminating enzyme
MTESYDAVVIGAGVFGAWIAYSLRASGRSVALLDAYGAANSRASSGGESRILRMGYGSARIYTRWAMRSRALWIDFFDRVKQPELFQSTGALWTTPPDDPRAAATIAVFAQCGVPFESLESAQLEKRFPQVRFSSERNGIFEPEGGALLARRAVHAVVQEAVRKGVQYEVDAALAPEGGSVRTRSGKELRAAILIYACGPWLPKIFPGVLQGRFRCTRQEVFFFGTPPGDHQFAPPAMPVWLDFSDQRRPYTIPNVDGRGFKLAFDRYGPEFDPDTGERVALGVAEAQAFIGQRFPALTGAPLLESRVCQYENTSTGDFLIDRHPEFDNVWLAGGGSGHGFKHGPAVGEYVAQLVNGAIAPDPAFSLAAQRSLAQRAVH